MPSLVGSEMCIRDSVSTAARSRRLPHQSPSPILKQSLSNSNLIGLTLLLVQAVIDSSLRKISLRIVPVPITTPEFLVFLSISARTSCCSFSYHSSCPVLVLHCRYLSSVGYAGAACSAGLSVLEGAAQLEPLQQHICVLVSSSLCPARFFFFLKPAVCEYSRFG